MLVIRGSPSTFCSRSHYSSCSGGHITFRIDARIRHHGADLPNANLLTIQADPLLAENGAPGESSTASKHKTATGRARIAQTTALNTMSNKCFLLRHPTPPGLGVGTASSDSGAQKSPRFATRERAARSSPMSPSLTRCLGSATGPPPFSSIQALFLGHNLQPDSNRFASSKHVHIHPCQALVPAYPRNPCLVTLERSMNHRHAIFLDDPLAHLHHMRVHVCGDVDPGNFIGGERQACIACRCERAAECGHAAAHLANPFDAPVCTNT